MIVDLPFSWKEMATPPRARTPREVEFTDVMPFDIPEVLSSELVHAADISHDMARKNRRILHDGTNFLRHVGSPFVEREMTVADFRRLIEGRDEEMRFTDYGLPTASDARMSDVSNPSFTAPVSVEGHQLHADRSACESAVALAGRHARLFVLVDGILFRKCMEPVVGLKFLGSGPRESIKVEPIFNRSILLLSDVRIPLTDYADPRFDRWFTPRDDLDLEVTVHRPDLFRELDALKSNGSIVSRFLNSAVSTLSRDNTVASMRKMMEILPVALSFSKVHEADDPAEVFASLRALDGVEKRDVGKARAVATYLEEACWIERSPSRQKTADLEAIHGIAF